VYYAKQDANEVRTRCLDNRCEREGGQCMRARPPVRCCPHPWPGTCPAGLLQGYPASRLPCIQHSSCAVSPPARPPATARRSAQRCSALTPELLALAPAAGRRGAAPGAPLLLATAPQQGSRPGGLGTRALPPRRRGRRCGSGAARLAPALVAGELPCRWPLLSLAPGLRHAAAVPDSAHEALACCCVRARWPLLPLARWPLHAAAHAVANDALA
jgi:hypothetical protein